MSNSNQLNGESRLADSPLIESVWHSRSDQAHTFLSIATSRLELVISHHDGQRYCSWRGPETHPTVAYCPPDGEWVGVQFKHGVFLSDRAASELVDREIQLPQASDRAFWLHGSAWEFPTFENMEAFIARLVKAELLVCDPVVAATLQGHATDLSPRTVDRRFLRATGLTHGTISQIERAHHAITLLQQGVSILDTVELSGYADQPHLTRSLKRLIGQTPARLTADSNPMPLSYQPTLAQPK